MQVMPLLLSHTTFSRPRSTQTLPTEQLARRGKQEPARRRRRQRRPGRCCEGTHSRNALRSERRRGKNGANEFHSTRHGGSRQNAGSACVLCSAALCFANLLSLGWRRLLLSAAWESEARCCPATVCSCCSCSGRVPWPSYREGIRW